jgi:hypothetical protein
MTITRNKDIWSGVMFMLVGAAAMFIASDYKFGTPQAMGPGFFPVMLGGLLVCFGAYLAVRGVRNGQRIRARVWLRPLILIPLALVLFGELIDLAGYVPAIVVLLVMACAASPEFKLSETVLITAALTLISVAVFVWALGLQFPLFAGS